MVDLLTAGLLLILAGFGVVVLSLISEGSKKGMDVKGGGVVLIGPIPIVFGSDAKWASIAIVLALVLVVLTLVLYLG